MPGPGRVEEDVARRLVGVYESKSASMAIAFEDGQRLTLTIPRQRPLELVSYRWNEFGVRHVSGYCVEFRIGDDGTATGAVVTEPNGEFRLELRHINE